MKTVSQLTTGKKPVGTTAYMSNIEHVMQCRCTVQTGTCSIFFLVLGGGGPNETIVNKSVVLVDFVRLSLTKTLCSCYFPAADDWLNPFAIQEAFEARALRMAVNCAQNISRAPSQEEGWYLNLKTM
jgi:acyl-CoA oxidase